MRPVYREPQQAPTNTQLLPLKAKLCPFPMTLQQTLSSLLSRLCTHKLGTEWLKEQMDRNPAAYMALLGKVLPMQVTGANEGPLVIRWSDGTEQE